MNTQEKHLFGSVEPEVVERIGAAAKDALRKNRKLAVIGSVPILLAAASAEAFADGLPQQVVDVLKYALTLEHFEEVACKPPVQQRVVRHVSVVAKAAVTRGGAHLGVVSVG